MALSRWKRGNGISCSQDGSLDCWHAELLCGNISEFHTKRLEDATRDINAILEAVMKDDEDRPPGADLSILETPDGLFLAWTQSSDEGVAIDNEDAIRQSLGTHKCSS